MNILYAKSVLYAYPVAEELLSQIDELVLKKALASMHIFSPAEEQCEKIIAFTEQKKIIIYMVRVLEEVIDELSEPEKDLLDYKYFKKKPKTHYKDFDYTSRAYFRRQQCVADKVAGKLESKGFNDEYFKDKCLKINFFRELLRRVKEKEILSVKNKSRSAGKTFHAYAETIKNLSGISPEKQKIVTEKIFA